MFRLTINMIFEFLTQLWPFQIAADMKKKVKIWLWHQFYHRTISHREISNVPFGSLTCPLQIINDIEPLIIDPSWFKCMLYPPTPFKKVKILTLTSIFSKSGQLQKNWNVLLDSLICTLQIINDIKPLTSTPHGVNACFIHHSSKSKSLDLP